MIARICAERHYVDGIIDTLCQFGFDEFEKLVSDRHPTLQYVECIINTQQCGQFYRVYCSLDAKKRGRLTFLTAHTNPNTCT